MYTDKLNKYSEDIARFFTGRWHYEDGFCAVAAEAMFNATGDSRYKTAALSYADGMVSKDGEIPAFQPDERRLDDILPGRALIFAYSQTGEERYLRGVNRLLEELETHPRTASGAFWHKKIYPNQVWLDGLYMAEPFRMAADTLFGTKENYYDILNQFQFVRQNLRDPATGLYFHGFDESRRAFWANPETGLSKSFWLRSIGWLLIALADAAEETDPAVYEVFRPLADMYKETLKAVLKYADPETGLFYQLPDRLGLAGNYLEASGSAMVAASIFKACRLRLVLEEKYIPCAEKTLSSLAELKLKDDGCGGLVLADTCKSAGLGPEKGRRDGSAEYYLSEPRVDDDPKGAAALILAYAEYIRYIKYKNGPRRSFPSR